MESEKQSVAILGASTKPERYSHMAQQMLMDLGYTVFPVSPSAAEILGRQCWKSVSDIDDPIDTITLYVGPQRLDGVVPGILARQPKRVIFNPGTESPTHEGMLADAGIRVQRACTLVLLRSEQF